MKSLALDLEHRLCTTGTFEEDLERRKRAVLTALCDAVLTTNSSFVVSGIDDGSEKLFRRSMMNETLTDYFKHEADKESFLAAVKRQFPDDDTVGEGPKRMRPALGQIGFRSIMWLSRPKSTRSGIISDFDAALRASPSCLACCT